MAHRKLERFKELETLPNCIYLPWAEASADTFGLKGKWAEDYFRNSAPIVLELGCGKGEYTIGLARRYPSKNFIGVDIKGNRLWRGARTATDENLKNVAFLRSRIDYIDRAFGADEVDEFWITFPDPQKEKARKRLTHPMFLDRYRKFSRKGAVVHLKTDSELLFEYTLGIIEAQGLKQLDATNDLYSNTSGREDVAAIQTYYERMYLKEGKRITYMKFELG